MFPPGFLVPLPSGSCWDGEGNKSWYFWIQNQRKIFAFLGNSVKILGEKEMTVPNDFIGNGNGHFWSTATQVGCVLGVRRRHLIFPGRFSNQKKRYAFALFHRWLKKWQKASAAQLLSSFCSYNRRGTWALNFSPHCPLSKGSWENQQKPLGAQECSCFMHCSLYF